MLLAIDIGNSHIVVGIFEGQQLQKSWRFATDHTKTADEYGSQLLPLLKFSGLQTHDISASIISSVVPPLTQMFVEMVETFFLQTPSLVTCDWPLGLTIRYDHPQEIGTDRLVNAAAAYARFHQCLIVVDFGTATTFCTVTSSGEYVGGAIAPGLKSAADSLHLQTAKLPTVDLVLPKTVIGKDTVSSIQSGLLFGYAGLVDAIVTRIQQEIRQPAFILATGGMAEVIRPLSQTIQEIRPNLTLEGLELLYRKRHVN